jgi:hypothetical protein
MGLKQQKITPVTQMSKIYVCKGEFYKTYKKLTLILKLFHTIVKKGSAKYTLWAALFSSKTGKNKQRKIKATGKSTKGKYCKQNIRTKNP